MGPELAREVARSGNTPPAVLARLAVSEDLQTVQKVAASKRTPPEILTQLAAHPRAEVVWWVAQNPATPLTCLEALTEHSDPKVRSWLASNPVMPISVLVRWQSEFPHLAYQALKTLVEYGEGADFSSDELARALALTDLIPAPAALRLLSSPGWHSALQEHAEKVAQAVRPQILAQLQGETP